MSDELRIKIAHQGQFGALMRQKLGLPPIPSQTYGNYEQPFTLGSITIYSAGITVGHSRQRECLTVTFWGTGLSGKQQKRNSLRVYPIDADGVGLWPHQALDATAQVKLTSNGSVQSIMPLEEWQAFIDQVYVRINGNSLTTIPLTDQLVKMARDVVAYRRKAPTDAEWEAETAIFEQQGKDTVMTDYNMVSIALDDLTLDPLMQPRIGIDHEVVEEYAQAMRDDDAFPPIQVYRVDGKNYVTDGWHRVYAAERADREMLLATVTEGKPLREAVMASAGANTKHGLRRSNEDKRKAVETVLRDDEGRQWSDREIARWVKVSHPLVAKVREELEASGNISRSTERKYIRDGQEVTVDTSNIGQNQPSAESTLTQHQRDHLYLQEHAPALLPLVETKGWMPMDTAALVARQAPDLIDDILARDLTGEEARAIIEARQAPTPYDEYIEHEPTPPQGEPDSAYRCVRDGRRVDPEGDTAYLRDEAHGLTLCGACVAEGWTFADGEPVLSVDSPEISSLNFPEGLADRPWQQRYLTLSAQLGEDTGEVLLARVEGCWIALGIHAEALREPLASAEGATVFKHTFADGPDDVRVALIPREAGIGWQQEVLTRRGIRFYRETDEAKAFVALMLGTEEHAAPAEAPGLTVVSPVPDRAGPVERYLATVIETYAQLDLLADQCLADCTTDAERAQIVFHHQARNLQSIRAMLEDHLYALDRMSARLADKEIVPQDSQRPANLVQEISGFLWTIHKEREAARAESEAA